HQCRPGGILKCFTIRAAAHPVILDVLWPAQHVSITDDKDALFHYGSVDLYFFYNCSRPFERSSSVKMDCQRPEWRIFLFHHYQQPRSKECPIGIVPFLRWRHVLEAASPFWPHKFGSTI